MQLDADENADPFYKPPPQTVLDAETSTKPDPPVPTVVVSEGGNDVEAAATATIEQES
jgi:hypothetical protein